MVPDVDLLGLQGLDFYVVLSHRLLVATLLHASCHSLIHVDIRLAATGKMPLHCGSTTHYYEVADLSL